MRVNVVQSADDGSHFYRMQLPAQTLAAQGLDVEIVEAGQEVRDADVWVFNRPTNKKFVEVVTNLVDMGRTVIIDVDDNFGAVRPGHALYGARSEEIHQYMLWACKYASQVTVTTRSLADTYGFGHATILPNYAPEWYLSYKPKPHNGVWVGWSGTVTSHPNDLPTTSGGVAKALRETGADFVYVGPSTHIELLKQGLKYKGRCLTSGWFSIEDYPKAIAEFDIGIVPLEPCEFNDSKSWLKMLEFSSTGVVPVVSPTQPNLELHTHGIGLVAEHAGDWRRHIAKLVKDTSYREEKALESREAAAAFTIERNAHKWAEAWESAHKCGTLASVS